MPKIIGVALLKGGVGKTTTAMRLAGFLARSGARVLVVDDDRNRSARIWAEPARAVIRCLLRWLTQPRQPAGAGR